LLTGSSDQYDQELDSLLVGPIPVGVNKFVFEADAPNTSRIPDNDILGVTVVLLTCAYDGREFVRVGYYVNNEYDSEELNAEPPSKLLIDRVRRNILSEKPRVTRFAIKWYVQKITQPDLPGEPQTLTHVRLQGQRCFRPRRVPPRAARGRPCRGRG
jgi:histone chaperone ASF1